MIIEHIGLIEDEYCNSIVVYQARFNKFFFLNSLIYLKIQFYDDFVKIGKTKNDK